MNRLIVASRENILVLDEAARIARDPERRSRLHEQSICHALMLLDLEGHIDAIGGIAISRLSFAARSRALWRRVRGMFAHERGRQTVTACLNAGLRTKAAYAAALSLPLSPDTRHDLEHQSDEVSTYHEYLEGLS
jgi:uncharacterized protein (TIGR02284 family)